MQNIQIAATIKELCKSKGITISSLLSNCNLTKSFIYDLEKRSVSPSFDKMSRIANYLGCSVDYLLGKEDEKTPSAESKTEDGLNIIRIAGRDGRLIEKHLTDEQLDAWMKIIDSLPDADF